MLGIMGMPNIDLDRLMNEPIYALDFQFMIGDVQDYLDFSENNIECQYRTELQSIKRHAEAGDFEGFPHDYREYLEANAEHRFKVSFPLKIRYGALLALTTAVEWSVVYLVQGLKMPIDKVPKGKNKTIHALEFINKHLGLRYGALIKDFEALVWLRNCIAHCAGIERDYEYRDKLPEAISRLKGFSLAKWHFLGSHVAIERSALDKYIEEMKHLVVNLYKAAHEQSFLTLDT
ncbi:hypothetical protein C8R26_1021 [Nitrosomonas oligotropha]|uniref:Uncharacterized protein n=2 Tax=Nitrosomonas oligotropha TaxID=42354 RepID=A0A2T5I3N4_9PROT|nr:hypothetical protein C8R26_1021 [Nitrosomonas oligotropha]